MVLKQRPPLLVTVSTAVLLVLGGAAAYFGITQRLLTKVQPPASMALVPSDALVALTLTTDESQWNRLRQLGTSESQQVLDRWLMTWRDRILSANGYRFRTDIQPWIGDQITLAFLPKISADGNEQELVLVVPIADPVRAQVLISEPQAGSTWVGRDYQGVGIQSITTASGETFESAVLATKWLVLASGSKGIESVIDSFAGGSAMLDDNAYRQAFKHLTLPNALAQIYVNLPEAAETLVASSALPDINGGVAAVNLLPNGLDIEAATWLGPEDQPVYVDMVNTRSLTPQRFPDSTVMMMSTSNIGPLWQALNEAERLNAMLPITSETLAKGLKTQTGLDFENDVLPWLSGEMAFGLLPPAAEAPNPIGQLALVAEVASRDAAEVTWSELDEVMANRFRFDVKPLEVDSQPVTQLVSHYGGIAMGYGWLDTDVTFFGMGATVLDAIAPRPPKSLKTHRAFQTLLDISPQDNAGYFFMDIDGLNNFQDSLPFPKLPKSPLISAIKSIGVTASVEDERSLSYDIFIELPRGRRVRPLSGNKSKNESQGEQLE